MNPIERYPGFWHAVLLCAFFVFLQMALIGPVMIADAVFSTRLILHPAVLGLVNLTDCAIVLLLARLIGRPPLPEVFAFRRVPILAVVGVIVTMPGAVILLSEVDNLMRLVLPPSDWIVRYFRELASQSGQRFWGAVFLLVLVAPLTEEVLFRGLILRGFLRRFPPARAFLWSAMLFGATHLNPWQFVSGTALGVVFAWYYARTGSLIPSLVGHALVNAAVVGQRSLGFEVRGFNAGEPFASDCLQPLWFDALGLVLFAAGLALFLFSSSPITKKRVPVAGPADMLAPPVIENKGQSNSA